MQFQPKTDEQIVSENLWPDGEYDFEVVAAEEQVSKKGNPMIKLGLKCFSGDRSRTVTDYVMEKMAFKLKHFLHGIGMGAAYDSGEFTAEQLVGRSGKVILKQEHQEGYQPKNSVEDYVVPGKEKNTNSGGAKSYVVGADEPPFASHEPWSW